MSEGPVTPFHQVGEVCHPSHPAELAAGVAHFARLSRAESTQRAYRSRWRRWLSWCEANGFASLPALPEVVAAYLSARALSGRALSTVQGDTAAIAVAHRLAFPDLDPPTSDRRVVEVLRGIARAAAPPNPARALRLTEIDEVIAHLDREGGTRAERDRALVLVGWALGARRSALVRLDWADFEERPGQGYAVRVRESKTDADAGGRLVGLPSVGGPACPVEALERWRACMHSHGIEAGPFLVSVNRHGRPGGRLSGRGLSGALQRLAVACGLADGISGHSLRRGLATAAAESGAGELAIMRQTGHASVATVRRYVEEGRIFRGNAAAIALGEER